MVLKEVIIDEYEEAVSASHQMMNDNLLDQIHIRNVFLSFWFEHFSSFLKPVKSPLTS